MRCRTTTSAGSTAPGIGGVVHQPAPRPLGQARLSQEGRGLVIVAGGELEIGHRRRAVAQQLDPDLERADVELPQL
jgi:hypothetical protein